MFDDRLREAREAIPGARAVLLVDSDGMVVVAAGDGPGDSLELLAASYADLARRTADANREADLEPCNEMTASGAAGAVVFRAVNADYGLLAVLGPGSLLGRARFEVRKLAARVAPELEI
jgi:predicted regulator of Ras-like GTPase activity (Roadblock/LC7/MglB family)